MEVQLVTSSSHKTMMLDTALLVKNYLREENIVPESKLQVRRIIHDFECPIYKSIKAKQQPPPTSTHNHHQPPPPTTTTTNHQHYQLIIL
ncbi:hypothetical protein NPIL_577451 [Nephila pilipes]|uniref:Uncharacterized protein n=1 Tax=Nephila pilipes TaxID=299642 RepID=A0A8X6TZA8_NEPPI|nr:hypothetical protein NPIL_577451 [Nephila pilipes]